MEKADGCWLWQAATNANGYGIFLFDGRPQLAHRVAWFLVHGEWPILRVCHHCDTPPCVNAETHLFQGTDAENAQDMARKGRKVLSTKLTPEQVREIRAMYVRGRVGYVRIGKMYGMSEYAITAIIKRWHWKHVD